MTQESLPPNREELLRLARENYGGDTPVCIRIPASSSESGTDSGDATEDYFFIVAALSDGDLATIRNCETVFKYYEIAKNARATVAIAKAGVFEGNCKPG